MYNTTLKNFLDQLSHFGRLGTWTLSAVLGPAFQIKIALWIKLDLFLKCCLIFGVLVNRTESWSQVILIVYLKLCVNY